MIRTASCLLVLISSALGQSVYEKDVDHALQALEKKCGHFFKLKGIKWKKVAKSFRSEARKVKSDQQHLVLLVRLLARLRDGHAQVRPLERGKDVRWPDDGKGKRGGPGLFLCRIGKKIFVKNSWSNASRSGIKPGMEVLRIDGIPVGKWLEARTRERSDRLSFSTDVQAFFSTCHWGLGGVRGERMKLDLKDLKGRARKRAVTIGRASVVAQGPAFFPDGLADAGKGNVRFGRTDLGHGYIHVRRCKSDLPAMMDVALAALGEVPGVILDFRGNSGGGFDHDALLGRFIPAGKAIKFNRKKYESTGPQPYGGPVVVIVDGTARSAAETASAMFKEDGRAYMIGESPTAGMSSGKETIALPSGLFALYVSVRSNGRRFNGGKGLEGIGAIPHEIVLFKPKDLAAGVDTLIARAEVLLAKMPANKVPYKPRQFGWGR